MTARPEKDPLALPVMGATLGQTTLDGNGRPVVSYSTPWGLQADGTPYYDPAGAAAGEEAVFQVAADGSVGLVKVTP